MNKIVILLATLIILSSCQNDKNSSNRGDSNKSFRSYNLNSAQDSIDYALGVVIANQMKKYGIKEVNYTILNKALKDVLENESQNLPFSADNAKKIISLYATNTSKRQKANYLDQNSNFLENNAKNSNIQTLDNGLQYEIISKGKGNSPKLTDQVVVHYTGKLADGRVFVSTEGGNPVKFVVKNSLPGWQSALVKMKEGAEWIIYLPPSLAYADKGSKNVPPNSVVIYRLKLIKIL